jgi:sugar phosphate permease
MVNPGAAGAGAETAASRLAAASAAEDVVPATYARHIVLGVTFVIALIMYIDRSVMGAATPAIMAEFGLDKITMGWTSSAFNWTYALLQMPGGWFADRFGPRIVLALAIGWWSLFTGVTGLAGGAMSLGLARGLFGAGEAAAFPSASRALVPWLPADQRAWGQGFQHAGARLGGAIGPALVMLMMTRFEWRTVFYLLGVFGGAWAIIWFAYYRDSPAEHPWTNAAERRLLPPPITSAKQAVPWRLIFRSRDIWALCAMYFCYGFVLWIYLQWLPTYLVEARQLTALKVGIGASLPLLAATFSNAAGGWVSDHFARKWGTRRGRITVSVVGFLVAAIGLVPGVLADSPTTALVWLIIALVGLELTVAVSWAMCIDVGYQFSGSVSGVMNTFGNLSGALSAVVVGYLATLYGWTPPFILGSGLCLVAAACALLIDPSRTAVGTRN